MPWQSYGSDDHQMLLLSSQKPWSSYTTFLIDQTPVIFGGPTHKRAGKNGTYGTIKKPPHLVKGTITTTTTYGLIEITQRLYPIRNPVTQVKDSVLIEYQITNTDTKTHTLGARIMLDTWLGKNDGAPFRMGDTIIANEQRYEGTHIIDFWQAFDQLDHPTIIGQGLLSSKQLNLSAPDKVTFTNWGIAADYPWDIPYQAKRSFVRSGEDDQDTAIVMTWNPLQLAPQQTRIIRTVYGLGGMDTAKGALSLGLTAPLEHYASMSDPFPVVGYLHNTTGFDSKKTTLRLTLPPHFKSVGSPLTRHLGNLKSGQGTQVLWMVQTDHPSIKQQTLKLDVFSSTLAENTLKRSITVLKQPDLDIETKVRSHPNGYQTLTVSLKNDTITPTLTNIQTHLRQAPLLWLESPTKQVMVLPHQTKKSLHWVFESPSKPVSFSVTVQNPLTKPFQEVITLSPSQPSTLQITPLLSKKHPNIIGLSLYGPKQSGPFLIKTNLNYISSSPSLINQKAMIFETIRTTQTPYLGTIYFDRSTINITPNITVVDITKQKTKTITIP